MRIEHGVQGDVIGAGFSGDGNIIAGELTLNLQVATPEAAREIALLAIPTELRSRSEAAAAPSATAPTAGGPVDQRIDEVLQTLRQLQANGVQAPTVQVGGVQLSPVDLLLKKATLLESEAARQPDGGVPQDEEEEAAGVGDTRAFYANLEHARALLTEARRLEPYNAEVLLHLSRVSGLLEDYEQERSLLQDARRLLDAPRDEREQFLRAQAMFLLEAVSEEPDRARITDARAVFERLGRTEWVRDIDALLAEQDDAAQRRWGAADMEAGMDERGGGGNSPPFDSPAPGKAPGTRYTGGSGLGQNGGAAGFGGPAQVAAMVGHAGQRPPGRDQNAAAFTPVGRWSVQFYDSANSTMSLDLRPDGGMSGTQSAAVLGISVPFAGQWSWQAPFLFMRGLINGAQPFFLQVALRTTTGDAMEGIDMNGWRCLFFRA
ncbi:MAG TPA: hypothetical protein VHG08_01025 [Longimicrobium sp.]|nr:hypothetical protein [Longimicrobium sp.]